MTLMSPTKSLPARSGIIPPCALYLPEQATPQDEARAWEQLYRDHFAVMCRRCIQRGLSESEAEQLSTSVLLEAHLHLRIHEKDPRIWLWSLLDWRLKDHFRSTKRQAQSVEAETLESAAASASASDLLPTGVATLSPEERVSLKELRQIVEETKCATLSPEERVDYELREAGTSFEEIRTMLAPSYEARGQQVPSEETLRQRHHRALVRFEATLRERLKKEYPDPQAMLKVLQKIH